MQEVAARGGKIILLTDCRGAEEASLKTMATLVLPDMAPEVAPIVYSIPVQLIAYHTAVAAPTSTSRATWRSRTVE
jgi:glucosamine--fructose-6-phosphate aminotransferase (isomerizing)